MTTPTASKITSPAGPKSKGANGPGSLRAVAVQPPKGKSAAQIRRRRMRRLGRNLALFVGVPTLLAAIYYLALASPQYESVSSFKVESADGSRGNPLAGFLGTLTGSSSGNQTLVVRDFILSRDMLAILAQQQDLVAHFRDPSIEWFSRLPQDATQEDAFDYYQGQVDLFYDTDSGVLTLQTRAFDVETAQAMNEAILVASERMVNQLSEKAQRDAIVFADEEVARAQERLSEARKKMLSLQGEEGQQFNPFAAAQSVQSVVTQLEGKLAQERAELNALQRVMGNGSPEAMRLRQKVSSLEREIRAQKSRLVPGERNEAVANSIARYEPVAFEKEFAERSLQSALTSMEMARVDAARQHRYLAVISAPSRPDAATHPDKLIGILRVFVVSLILAGLGGLVVASMREHMRI